MKKEHTIQVVSALIILMLCSLNIRHLDYVRIINDEFGYWAHAISAVGYDWSDLIAETPYYSWGYSLWLIPIVAILPTPELWYKAAIMLNVLFLIASYFLCVNCGKRLFPKADMPLISIVSLLTIIYPGNVIYAQATWTESLLYVLMWLETYLIISLDEKFKLRSFLGAVAILAYMYAVHARSIGIIIAGIIFLTIIIVKHKKNMGYWILMLLSLALGYFVVEVVKNYNLEVLWNHSQASNLNNVALNKETVEGYLNKITNQTLLTLGSLGGKYIYLIVATGLTLPVAVGLTIKETVRNVKEKKIFDECILGKWWGIVSMTFMWGVCSLQMNYWEFRKDIIVYGRYMENAIGPVLFMGIMYTAVYAKEVKKELMVSVLSLVLGLYPVCKCISQANGGFNVNCSPIIAFFYQIADVGILRLAFIAVLILAVMAVIFLYAFPNDDRKRWTIIVPIFFTLYFLSITFQICKDIPSYYASLAEGMEPLRTGISGELGKEEVYFVKNSEMPLRLKHFQFIVPERGIHVVSTGDMEQVFTEGNLVMVETEDTEMIGLVEDTGRQVKVAETSWFCIYRIEGE